MKRLPLLSLSLVASLGVGCSNLPQEGAPSPTPQVQVKKRTQALGDVTLKEIPVSAAVLAAAEGNGTVRAFQIEASEGSISVGAVVAAALQAGASDPVNQPWQAGVERDREETRLALKYLDGLLPAIEAAVGTGEEYRSGYYHWWKMLTPDYCGHGDFYGLVFEQARQVFIIEASGGAAC